MNKKGLVSKAWKDFDSRVSQGKAAHRRSKGGQPAQGEAQLWEGQGAAQARQPQLFSAARKSPTACCRQQHNRTRPVDASTQPCGLPNGTVKAIQVSASEIAGFCVGALLVAATVAAPRVDLFIAQGQRRNLGLCMECGGLGRAYCSKCKGRGRVTPGWISLLPSLLTEEKNAAPPHSPCDSCRGKGHFPCSSCSQTNSV